MIRYLPIVLAGLLVSHTALADAPAADLCGAAALQSFVGKPKDKLPANLPKSTRLTCTTCPVTMDYNAARLNVIFDTDSGIVKQIRCG